MLLHLVDATGPDPVGAWRTVRKELKLYGAGLIDKIEVIGLNKVDALPLADAKKIATKLKRASKSEVLMLSAAGGDGVQAVLDRLETAVGPAPVIVTNPEDPDTWSPL